MTKAELRQKLLFACMQNPAIVETHADGKGRYNNTKSIHIALDLADDVARDFVEEFDIE